MTHLWVFVVTLLSSLCVVHGKPSAYKAGKSPHQKDTGAFCGESEITTARTANSRANYNTPGYWSPSQRYRNNLNCSTSLQLHYSQRNKNIRIKVMQIDIQGGRGCNNDYIMIFDESGRMMAKICGSSSRNTLITVPSNEARVVFVTDSAVIARGAKLKFWGVNPNWRTGVACGGNSLSTGQCIHCGGTLRSSSGIIESVFYGEANYPSNMACEWNIDTGETQDGQLLRLVFVNLHLEMHEQCLYDHVRIYEPTSSSPLATVCGSTCTPEIIISSQAARIIFQSDLTVNYEGFTMYYEFIPLQAVLPTVPGYIGNSLVNCQCGRYDGCISSADLVSPNTPYPPTYWYTTTPPVMNQCSANYTALSGTLRSPNYPDNYPNNARCISNITVPYGMHIRLTLLHFELEYESDCSWDSLSVYLDWGSLAYSTLCGSHSGTRDLPSNRATLVFESDSSVTDTGYEISYTAIRPEDDGPDDENALCGGTLTYPSGEIMTPNFPDDYPNDAECHWILIPPQDMVIQLQVVNFDLEPHSSCNYDRLTVWDGYSCAHFCGNGTQIGNISHEINYDNGIVTLGDTLSLVFTSDYSVTHSGFHFLYQFVDPYDNSGEDQGSGDEVSSSCGGQLTASSGVILSPNYPNYYPSGIECEWVISVDYGLVIRVHAEEWHLESSASCSYDYLAVIDGASEFRYCNYFLDYTSSGNILVLEFVTDSSITHSGFRLIYEAVHPSEIIDNGSGNFGNATCGPVYSAATVAAPLIVGGNDAERNEYPWMVMLQSYGSFICGGSIISDRWIITAAHCVEDGSSGLTVIVGSHTINEAEYVHSVSRVFLHHGYDSYTNANDIAMLEVTPLITMSSNVAPVCLSRDDPAIGLNCIITGWGDTESVPVYNLQEAVVPVIDNEECSESGYGSELLEDMMCAGYFEGGIDTCYGDSGGPLACLIGGVWELHGVTSWGYGCADRYYPGIYTRVARYIDWIMAIAVNS